MIPLQSFASAGLSGRLHWFQHPWAMGMTAAKPKALTRADLENIIVVVIDCECVSVLQNFRAREKRVRTGNIQTLVRRQSVGICERARSLVDYPRHSEQKCFWSLACLMLTKMAGSFPQRTRCSLRKGVDGNVCGVHQTALLGMSDCWTGRDEHRSFTSSRVQNE